jgi:hypothetical protein
MFARLLRMPSSFLRAWPKTAILHLPLGCDVVGLIIDQRRRQQLGEDLGTPAFTMHVSA